MSTLTIQWANGNTEEFSDTTFSLEKGIWKYPGARWIWHFDDISNGLFVSLRVITEQMIEGHPRPELGEVCFPMTTNYYQVFSKEQAADILSVKLGNEVKLRRSEVTGELLNLSKLNALAGLYLTTKDELSTYAVMVDLFNAVAHRYTVKGEKLITAIAYDFGIPEEDLKEALASCDIDENQTKASQSDEITQITKGGSAASQDDPDAHEDLEGPENPAGPAEDSGANCVAEEESNDSYESSATEDNSEQLSTSSDYSGYENFNSVDIFEGLSEHASDF